MSDVNYVAILIAGVAAMVIGFLWYGPLFGKKWMKLVGMTKADMKGSKKDMPKSSAMMFVGALIMAYVLSVLAGYMDASDFASGAMVGFWGWLGFVAPISASDVIWEKKSWELWFLNNAHWLVALSIMGGIVASWQ